MSFMSRVRTFFGGRRTAAETQAEAKKPDRTELGATGTSVFAGLLYEEDYNTDLQGEKGLKVYDKMRRSDGQVKAGLLACKLPLLVARWDIAPGSDSAEDVEIAETVKADLFENMADTWDDFLRQALIMLDFGHMPFEKVWEIRDGHWAWRKLAPRLPASITEWHITKEGDLDYIIQQASVGDQFKTMTIPASKLLLFTHEREGSNYRGISMLRAAYKHWWYKNNLYAIDGIAAERHGVGLARFTYPDQATQAQKDKVAEVGERLHAHERSYAALPESIKLDLLGVQGQLHDIKGSIDHHDLQIVRSILAQFMNLGAKTTGSYALSQDQSQFFLMALQSVGKNICNTMNRNCIREMVDYNWNVTKYPHLTVSGLDSPDVMGYAQAIASLMTAGAITTDIPTENELRRMVKLPPKQVQVPALPQQEETQEEKQARVAFDPSQPRDEEGQWTDGGGSSRRPSGSARKQVKSKAVPSMTVPEIDSAHTQELEDWTGNAHEWIRGAEKKGNKTPEVVRFQKALDEVPTYDGTVYRGGGISETRAGKLKVGKELVLNADSGSSVERSIAEKAMFDDQDLYRRKDASPVMYELKSKTGADIRHYVNEQESEVVLRQGTRYKITGHSQQVVKGQRVHFVTGVEL